MSTERHRVRPAAKGMAKWNSATFSRLRRSLWLQQAGSALVDLREAIPGVASATGVLARHQLGGAVAAILANTQSEATA
jgi:hypothetical protein